MAEVNDLQTVAANNTARFPEGMTAAQLNDNLRELEAMIGRYHRDHTGVGLTTGTGTALVLTAYRTVAALAAGYEFTFRCHVAVGTSPTLQVNGLTAKSMVHVGNLPIMSGDIAISQMVRAIYNSSLDKFEVVGAMPAVLPTFTVATVPSAATFVRRQIYVSDESGGAIVAFSDGTNWRRLTDRAVIS